MFGTLIPADYSIDDELLLLPVNLNGKKVQRYGHAVGFAILHILSCPTPGELVDTDERPVLGSEDRRIRAPCRQKLFVVRRLER